MYARRGVLDTAMSRFVPVRIAPKGEVVSTPTVPSQRASRFELAPPRRFVLPAILLLLSEQSSYGYSLQKDLEEFRFGPIDRPTIYRALAQLETDGLVESWSEAPKAGQARRVYGITPLGEQVQRIWMNVIRQERDCLGRVLHRYQATSVATGGLDDLERAWVDALELDWSPTRVTPGPRQLVAVGAGRNVGRHDVTELELEPEPEPQPTAPNGDVRSRRRFRVVPDRSVVLIEVRSTVGPLSFGALGLTGSIEADIVDGAISAGTAPSAHVEVAVNGLRSGNSVYDAELHRRIDARRFPTAMLDLRDCIESHAGGHYRLVGELAFHGVARAVHGTVNLTLGVDGGLTVTGEHVFDVRDFDVPCPAVLMLRFYPDLRVSLHVEAEPEDS